MAKLVFIMFYMLLVVSSCGELPAKLKNKMGLDKKAHPIDTVLFSHLTNINFQNTLIDLGTVKEGSERRIVFYYQNTGKFPLLLFNVSPSCGCTIAEFSHNPLEPGQTDSIVAKFDSKDRVGTHQKNIKVNCNTEQKVHDLYFKVQVVK